jgi:hypothetical protein
MPRVKQIHGYATGDLVRAVVPAGKHAGTHMGRVAVRSSGSHTVQTFHGPVTTSWKHLRLLQRADGYAYNTRGEVDVAARSGFDGPPAPVSSPG